MKKPVILFRASLAEEEEIIVARKYFEVIEQRNDIHDSFVVGRYSTLPFYLELEKDLKINNSELLNSYQQYNWIANFDWYEPLKEFTFETWFHAVELPDDGTQFVVKGRTNSRKQNWDTQMFAKDKRDAIEIGWKLSQDSLIGSQGVVYRRFEKLVTYEIGINGLPFTREFRMFYYKGKLITHGYYWSIADDTEGKILPDEAIEFANKVADIAKDYTNFFVLDVAQKETGEWILVEVNDGQMAGTSCIDLDHFYSNLKKEVDNDLA